MEEAIEESMMHWHAHIMDSVPLETARNQRLRSVIQGRWDSRTAAEYHRVGRPLVPKVGLYCSCHAAHASKGNF